LSLAVAHHFQPSNNQQQDNSGSRIDCPSSPERTWRKIVVEVSPTEIRLQWDGRQSITTSRRELNKLAYSLYNDILDLRPPEPRPPLTPRSSMGLYSQKGSASFRNVVLKPMNPVAGR
jgi:hypothetical protein